MTDRLFQFQWTVAECGYQIRPLRAVAGASESLYLTASVPLGQRYPGFRYSPQSGLFIQFARLEPHEEQIVEFANSWGMLTEGVLLGQNDSLVSGEALEVWRGAIGDLSLAFRIWELIKAADTSGLGKYFSWPDASRVLFTLPDHRGGRWIAARETNLTLLETFQVGDLVAPAWYQLQYMVNEKLDGNVSARLLWNSSHNRLSLYQVPRDLISALWLQFARAIEGGRQYQQCEECRNWFEISSPDGGRKDKRFCSTACRARSWRKTKDSEI